MALSLPEKPIVSFLHTHLQQLAPLFSDVELTQLALVDALRDKFREALYSPALDTRFLPFLFLSCQAIPGLNVSSLSLDLASRSSPTPTFMSTPPPSFDSALVPIDVSVDAEVVGSGY